MHSDEIASAIARFFDGGLGPSHDQLDRLFERYDVASADPRASGDTQIGKMKRVRAVLGYAVDAQLPRMTDLVVALIGTMKACDCFLPDSPHFAGADAVAALRRAFDTVGYDLDDTGALRPKALESLEGAELTEALWSYVRRARTGADDAALLIGVSKSLEEAAARHILKEKEGSYPAHGGFPMLLGAAYQLLGLEIGPALQGDAYSNLQQAIFNVGVAVNRLRNEKGEGHGRPEPPTATALEGRLSALGSALVTELLLTVLDPRLAPR